jgi:hypothetical protein
MQEVFYLEVYIRISVTSEYVKTIENFGHFFFLKLIFVKRNLLLRRNYSYILLLMSIG